MMERPNAGSILPDQCRHSTGMEHRHHIHPEPANQTADHFHPPFYIWCRKGSSQQRLHTPYISECPSIGNTDGFDDFHIPVCFTQLFAKFSALISMHLHSIQRERMNLIQYLRDGIIHENSHSANLPVCIRASQHIANISWRLRIKMNPIMSTPSCATCSIFSGSRIPQTFTNIILFYILKLLPLQDALLRLPIPRALPCTKSFCPFKT